MVDRTIRNFRKIDRQWRPFPLTLVTNSFGTWIIERASFLSFTSFDPSVSPSTLTGDARGLALLQDEGRCPKKNKSDTVCSPVVVADPYAWMPREKGHASCVEQSGPHCRWKLPFAIFRRPTYPLFGRHLYELAFCLDGSYTWEERRRSLAWLTLLTSDGAKFMLLRGIGQMNYDGSIFTRSSDFGQVLSRMFENLYLHDCTLSGYFEYVACRVSRVRAQGNRRKRENRLQNPTSRCHTKIY